MSHLMSMVIAAAIVCLCGIAVDLVLDTWCCHRFQCSVCCCDALGIDQPHFPHCAVTGLPVNCCLSFAGCCYSTCWCSLSLLQEPNGYYAENASLCIVTSYKVLTMYQVPGTMYPPYGMYHIILVELYIDRGNILRM